MKNAIRRTARAYSSWLPILAVIYLLLYGSLLLSTRGYPYVLDNNESYSSLWHARSLFVNGTSHTIGLTDEVFSTSPAASPYIHSHQGNFPRLYSFILYAIGIRTVGAQIWITTFTVGLAAIFFAFRFLSRLSNPLFAGLVCLLLMTDYLFFVEWQVSLYNVWHGFFFFSSLLCIQELGKTTRRWQLLALTLLNFSALFYWEYVFTVFVTTLCVLYSLVLYRRQLRLVMLAAASIAGGALIAAGTLLTQLTAYMGWSNVLEDMRLTLTARNAAANPALLEKVTTFYHEHHIIFWYNFLDATPLRSLTALWNSLFEYHLKYYSPSILYALTVLLVGWLFGQWRWQARFTHSTACSSSSKHIHTTIAPWAKFLVLTAGFILLFLSFWPWHLRLLVLAAGSAFLFGWVWSGTPFGWQRLPSIRLVLLLAFMAISRAAYLWTSDFPGATLPTAPLFQSIGLTANFVERYIVLASTALGMTLAGIGDAQLLGRLRAQRLTGLLPYLLCTVVAYFVTYRVFTGYVYSGYLYRFVPLPVFITVTVIGLIFYATVRILQRTTRKGLRALTGLPSAVFRLFVGSEHQPRHQIATDLMSRLVAALPLILTFCLLVGLAAQWGILQTSYLRIIPPDNYAFLARLENPPFQGHSLVSNTYPAPMAARMGKWGYADTSIFSGRVRLDPHGYQIERDLKYLWFADRDTNPDYLRPDFAINVSEAPNFDEALNRYLRWQDGGDTSPTVENTGLFKRATNPFQAFLRDRVVTTDGRHFSAIKLDWDYPPYLEPQSQQIQELANRLTLAQKLNLSASAHSVARQWRLEVSSPDFPSRVPEDVHFQCDGIAVVLTPLAAVGGYVAVVNGDHLQLQITHSPVGRHVRVVVNEMAETFDLTQLPTSGATFDWFSSHPYGKYTSAPTFSPGFYVQTKLIHRDGHPSAELSYRYAHQEGAHEAATVLRLYEESPAGKWRLVDAVTYLGSMGPPVRLAVFRAANLDTLHEYARVSALGDRRTYQEWLTDFLATHPEQWNRPGIVQGADSILSSDPCGRVTRILPLPPSRANRFQFSISPGTRTKSGPEYFGLPFSASAFESGSDSVVAFATPPLGVSSNTLPFGKLRIRLRFPERWPQAEPIVSTGSNEAGDFIYVIYRDSEHIQLGFDHWFKGGPLTKPIAIDYSKVHTLEISMGSLFPPAEDVVFVGMSSDVVASLKGRVIVKLDGKTVIDAAGNCYDSSPEQVTVGRNDINGTSAGPLFSGKILSVERDWIDHP